MSEYKFGTWYPAEIAPKDIPDRQVLVFDGKYEIAIPANKSDNIWSTDNEYLMAVTHWMPLPPPPSNGERKEGDE